MATGQRVDPYNNFNFLVEIDGIARAAFQEASGFDSSIDITEHREGGENTTMRKLPAMTKYSNITLKWGTPAIRRPRVRTVLSSFSIGRGRRKCAGISSAPGLRSGPDLASTLKATTSPSRRWSWRMRGLSAQRWGDSGQKEKRYVSD